MRGRGSQAVRDIGSLHRKLWNSYNVASTWSNLFAKLHLPDIPFGNETLERKVIHTDRVNNMNQKYFSTVKEPDF